MEAIRPPLIGRGPASTRASLTRSGAVYPNEAHDDYLATITERKDNTKLSWFKRWLGGLLFISPDPRRMSALAQRESAFPAIDLSNFADWYRHLRLENAWCRIGFAILA